MAFLDPLTQTLKVLALIVHAVLDEMRWHFLTDRLSAMQRPEAEKFKECESERDHL